MTDQPLRDLHAIGYCRVSTDDKGQDPETQADAIHKWADANGVLIDRIFLEEASGTLWPRPVLSTALVTLRTTNASILVCYDQSRLTRDGETQLPLINELLGEGKIIRYVTNGDVDADNIGIRLTNAIRTITDAEERKKLSARTSMALVHKRDVLHIHVGRPARLVICEDLATLNRGKVTASTTVLRPDSVLNFARNGWTLHYVANNILHVDLSILYRAVKGAGLLEEYRTILQEVRA